MKIFDLFPTPLYVPAVGRAADQHTGGEAADGDTNGGAAAVTITGTCDLVLEPWVVETIRQGTKLMLMAASVSLLFSAPYSTDRLLVCAFFLLS